MYGPFFNERLMFLSFRIISSYVQQYTGWMPSSAYGFKALGQQSLTGTRMSSRSTAFSTTHRVIHRVHGNPANTRTAAHPAVTACFPRFLQDVVSVTYYPYGSPAGGQHHADLAGR